MTILTRLSENRKTTIKQIMREKGKTIYYVHYSKIRNRITHKLASHFNNKKYGITRYCQQD